MDQTPSSSRRASAARAYVTDNLGGRDPVDPPLDDAAARFVLQIRDDRFRVEDHRLTHPPIRLRRTARSTPRPAVGPARVTPGGPRCRDGPRRRLALFLNSRIDRRDGRPAHRLSRRTGPARGLRSCRSQIRFGIVASPFPVTPEPAGRSARRRRPRRRRDSQSLARPRRPGPASPRPRAADRPPRPRSPLVARRRR